MRIAKIHVIGMVLAGISVLASGCAKTAWGCPHTIHRYSSSLGKLARTWTAAAGAKTGRPRARCSGPAPPL